MVLTDLQGKGLVRKEASLLKAFLVTFVATKVTGPPRPRADIRYAYLRCKVRDC